MASKYLKVKCECGNVQTIFSHATSEVKCAKCGKTVSHQAGGKAIIDADIVEELG